VQSNIPCSAATPDGDIMEFFLKLPGEVSGENHRNQITTMNFLQWIMASGNLSGGSQSTGQGAASTPKAIQPK